MHQADHIVACARSFLGVRFAHQGRHPANGLDCLGLLIATAAKAGVTVSGQPPHAFDERAYGARPDGDYLQAMLERHLEPVESPGLGNIMLLKIDGRPQHLAIITDYPAAGEWGMIHAYAVARRVVEHRLDALWRDAIHAIYRLRS